MGRTAIQNDTMKVAADPFRRLVALLMIITISRIHQHFGFLDPLRPALTLTILAGAYAYMNPRFLHPGIFETRPAKLMVAMGVMACISVPFGMSMGASGRFVLEDFSKVLIFAFLVVAGIRFTRDLYTFVWAFVVSIGFLSYLSLFVFKMSEATSDGMSRIVNGYSYDANDIGTVAVVGLPLVLLALTTSTGKKKVVAAIILLGVGGTIAKTGSRGAFLGLIAVGIALLVMLKSVPVVKRLAFVAVTAVALAFFAPAGYWEQMNTLTSPKEDYNWTSPTGRREVFKRGVNYTIRHPFTGLGIENFARAEGTISDRAIAQARDPSLPGIKWSAAHNSFLQAAAELGIPGLIIFTSLVLIGVINPIRLRRSMPPGWIKGSSEERFLYLTSVYLPVSFIGFIAAGFFVSFAYMDLIYVLSAFNVGLTVALQDYYSRRDVGASSQVPLPVFATGTRQYRGGLPPASAPDVDGPRYAPR